MLGAVATLTGFLIGSPLWTVPPMAYGLVLLLSGILAARSGRGASSIVGVPVCLLLLHTSFSLGLMDGLVRKGRFSNDRA